MRKILVTAAAILCLLAVPANAQECGQVYDQQVCGIEASSGVYGFIGVFSAARHLPWSIPDVIGQTSDLVHGTVTVAGDSAELLLKMSKSPMRFSWHAEAGCYVWEGSTSDGVFIDFQALVWDGVNWHLVDGCLEYSGHANPWYIESAACPWVVVSTPFEASAGPSRRE